MSRDLPLQSASRRHAPHTTLRALLTLPAVGLATAGLLAVTACTAPGMRLPAMPGQGFDCAQIEQLGREGQALPDDAAAELMRMLQCPSSRPPAPEPDIADRADTSLCTTLDGDNLDPRYGAWLGPMVVHAAPWMLTRCADQLEPAEVTAWRGLALFGEGRYLESAATLEEAADAAGDGFRRLRFTIEAAKSLLAAGRADAARTAADRALGLVDTLDPDPTAERGAAISTRQQALRVIMEESAAEDREQVRNALRAELLMLRGLSFLNEDDLEPAAADLENAAALLTPELPPGMPGFLPGGPAAGLAEIYLAMVFARTGQHEQAVALLEARIAGRDEFLAMPGQAQASLEMAREAIQSLGMELPFSVPDGAPAGLESMMTMSGELFQIDLACMLLQNIHLNANAAERALAVAEQCRARALARSLAERSFQHDAVVTLPDHREIRKYARRHRVDEATASQALLQEQLRNVAADTASRPATVDDMRLAARTRNATILVYAIDTRPNLLPDRMPDREVGVTIWVMTADGRVTVRQRGFEGLLGGGTLPLSAAVYRARQALELPGRGGSNMPTPAERASKGATAALRRFHALLIEPVRDLLPDGEGARLLIVPQGALFLVPFAALEDAAGNPLVARYAISTTPSMQTLAITSMRRQPAATGEALVVGNPVMPTYTPVAGEPPLDLPALPGAEEEAQAIAALLDTSPLTGRGATKSAVISRASTARYVHLATHGILDNLTGESQRGADGYVRQSTATTMEQRQEGGQKTPGVLALAPEDRDGGLLFADEIAQARTPAELVVMSACDSGRGAINDDGVIGLSRAWIAAGAASVLVSLWAIPDDPTRYLMVEFYRHLVAGHTKAEALREAMLATRARYPSPVNWAAFVLVGEPG